MKAWLFTLAEDQKYWGNQGYDNTQGTSYSYDSFVANYRQVAVNDIVIERVGSRITGVSTIDGISVKRGTKEIFRCPDCRNSRLRKRKTVSPPWICEKGHKFGSPEVDTRPCILCNAQYEASYMTLEIPLESMLIDPVLMSGNKMFAIQEVGLKKLLDARDERLRPLVSLVEETIGDVDSLPKYSPTSRLFEGGGGSYSSLPLAEAIGTILVGPRIQEAEALGKLKTFVSGCCAEDDTSATSHNKNRLPISSDEFDQLNAEIDAANALLLAPRVQADRLTPLVQLLEKLKEYADIFAKNASASIGNVTGLIVISAVVQFSGLLDSVIKILSAMIK